MLGWCMMLLAGLVWLPPPVVGGLGLVVIACQQRCSGSSARDLPGARARRGRARLSAAPIHARRERQRSDRAVLARAVDRRDGGRLRLRRDNRCAGPAAALAASRIGLGATLLFVAASLDVYGDPRPAERRCRRCLRAPEPAKYPASLLFLLMTLGPGDRAAAARRARARPVARALTTFGRVPLFFYLLHIPLIHALALIVWGIRDVGIDDGAFKSAPYVRIPDPQRWNLPLLYLVWAIAVAILYVACRWYASVKARSTSPWLRYL